MIKKTVIHTIHFLDEAGPISREAWDKLGHYVVEVGPETKMPKPMDPAFVANLIPTLYDKPQIADEAQAILNHKRALKAAQMRRYRAKKAGK